MVGCDTQLVAPVKVGNDVYVASGTTIVREVPDGALCVVASSAARKAWMDREWRHRHGDRPNGRGLGLA